MCSDGGSTRGYHPQLIRSQITEVDDASQYGEQQVTLTGLDGEQLQEIYRPQYYGLSGRPPANTSHGMLVTLGGERNSSFLLGGEDPDQRPQGLNDSEVKLYDASGNIVWMGMKNGITMSTASGDATVKTSNGKITIQSDGHTYVTPSGGSNVYLGGQGGARIMTESGPAQNVYAKV